MCHTNKDVLTANLLLCDSLSIDFGFAQYMSPWDEKSVLRGSPLYMAPEMVCRRQYDSRVDLWSVGVILYGEFWLYVYVCMRAYYIYSQNHMLVK